MPLPIVCDPDPVVNVSFELTSSGLPAHPAKPVSEIHSRVVIIIPVDIDVLFLAVYERVNIVDAGSSRRLKGIFSRTVYVIGLFYFP